MMKLVSALMRFLQLRPNSLRSLAFTIAVSAFGATSFATLRSSAEEIIPTFKFKGASTEEYELFRAACRVDLQKSKDDTYIKLKHHIMYHSKYRCEDYEDELFCPAFIVSIKGKNCRLKLLVRRNQNEVLDAREMEHYSSGKPGAAPESPIIIDIPARTRGLRFYEYEDFLELF